MKRYETYKDSKVKWIGEIPETWSMKKLAYGFKKIGSGTTPTAGNQEYYLAGNYNWLQTGDLNDGVINSTSKKITQKAIDNFSALKFYEPGSLVIAMYGATIGKTGILNIKTTTNQACCILSEPNSFISKYVFYWFNANKSNIISLSYGGGQPNINQEIIRSLRIPCPQKEEQSAIVHFLDEKTVQINNLIAKKQRLIELLNEERTAIINQAVTTGIAQKVELKPSGIEWLGDIPKHWEVKKLKYVALIKYGLGQPPKQKIDGLPLIRATNVEKGKIIEKDLMFVDPEDIPYDRDPVLKEYDIIVVRSGAYTGDSAIVPQKYEGAITGYDMVVRVVEADPTFVSFCLLSNYVLVNQLYLNKLRAAQPHLNKEELGETLLIIPNLKEQLEIVRYIELETEKIDLTISKVKTEIALMQEYLTALISEVVTGKIKVI